MRTLFGILLMVVIFMTPDDACRAQIYKYRAGLQYGLGNYHASERPNFSFAHNFGFQIGGGSGNRNLIFSVLKQTNYSDSAQTGNFGFFADDQSAQFELSSLRIGFDMVFRLKKKGTIQPTVGLGLGYSIWKYKDPSADTVIKTFDKKGGLAELAAAELYISPSIGLDINLSDRTILGLSGSYDFLTGIGTSFVDSANDLRARSALTAKITLSYLFGTPGRNNNIRSANWTSTESWTSSEPQARPEARERDSDGDGIYDRFDDCPNTPIGARVNRSGCPSDGDRDGIPDGLDDCPKTEPAARGMVDIFGCPIDTDYDGVPNYIDYCDGPIGALVNDSGCPTDGDGDGVYDGLDDCPVTDAGIDVDQRGCIDISFMTGITRLNIDYDPGSFEIDERSKKRLMPLIKKLLILSDVKIQIHGYTDNVGPSEANQIVSQRRANRLRDWLEFKGVARDRMKAVGKGETRFVASNQTAKGRAQNRRIEISFSTD